MLRYEVDGNGILGAARNNHVRVLFRWQAELFKSRLHQACVLGRWNLSLCDCLWLQGFYLVENIFKISSPVSDVPHHPPAKIQNKSEEGMLW